MPINMGVSENRGSYYKDPKLWYPLFSETPIYPETLWTKRPETQQKNLENSGSSAAIESGTTFVVQAQDVGSSLNENPYRSLTGTSL